METGMIRRVVGYLLGKSPEIILHGGVANGLVTFVLYKQPEWRLGVVFAAWAVVGGGLVLATNVQGRDEIAKGAEPVPWRTLVVLQLLYVGIAWALFTLR